jgi:beta-glucosidase
MKYKEIIDKMTLEEKASLMSGKDFWTTQEIERLGIPSIFLADGPHGIRKQASASDQLGLNASIPATCFPTAATVANSWNLEIANEMGKFLGIEALCQGVNILLGPGTNIKRNPLCGRNFEYFSEDPFLAGKLSASYVLGIQSTGTFACLKHFAANNQEYRRMVIDSIIDERTLREIYLKPFEIGIKDGKVKTLMSSYNMLNGTHTNENQHLMIDILRRDWSYKGLVVTDWGGSNDRVLGLKARNSLEMPSTSGETNEEIIEAIKTGVIEEKVLDENVDILLEAIYKSSEAMQKEKQVFDLEKHHLMAQSVAEDSIILLKNKEGLLPIKSKTKVAIIGDFARKPRYQGAGSSIVNPTKIDDTLTSIKEYDLEYVGFEPGYNRYGKPSKRMINNAIELAKKAEVILIYIGLDEYSEVEGIDRKSFTLPNNQIDLVEALAKLDKKLVAVLSCGSAVEMNFEDHVDGLVHSYLSGQAGAKAVLNILTGKVNPSGKLSETIPYRYSDYPNANNFPGKEVSAEYKEGIYVGYRYFDKQDITVRHEFGYGLSYTSFEYDNLEVNKDFVEFNIKNTGKVKGKEVAQLYVRAKNSNTYRADKELKGFIKVELESQAQKRVKINLSDDSFSFYNPNTNSFVVEDLDYEILIGASSRDIRLQETIHIDGLKINPDLTEKEIPNYYSGNIKEVNTEEFERLLGRNTPNPNYQFYKKNRMVVHYNTTVEQLKYSKGFAGRWFFSSLKAYIKLLKLFGRYEKSSTMIMIIYHLPMRGLARMSGGMISKGQLEGLMLMFNGKFFKGLKKFFKERRIKRKNNMRSS